MAAAESLGSTFRVIQIHPTRRCNLTCLHCYSLSGPDQHEALDVDLLAQALNDARDAGYNALGVSGGEPLVYKPLRTLLQHARDLGMATTVTTNGMMLDNRRLALLGGVTTLLAISLDGVPDSHNRMRNSDKAFSMMAGRLEGVRRSGLPFGFIFTLTQFNLHELAWVIDFALSQGASLLQVHPLESVGRAAEMLSKERPDEVEATIAYLEVRRQQEELRDRLRIQLDFAPKQLLRKAPELVFADSPDPGDPLRPLAEVVSPVVIEPDGEVVPLEFGFARRYALGNLHHASFADLAASWRVHRAPAFRELCRNVRADAITDDAPRLMNWYEVMYDRANSEP